MRDEPVLISFRRPPINGRETKDAGSKVSLRGVVFNILFGDQLRPFQGGLIRIVGDASLRHFLEIIRVRAIDVFGRSENKNRIRFRRTEQIYRAFDVRAKALLGVGRVFAEMSSEMNYDFVGAGARGI